jgi:hypothetical protein
VRWVLIGTLVIFAIFLLVVIKTLGGELTLGSLWLALLPGILVISTVISTVFVFLTYYSKLNKEQELLGFIKSVWNVIEIVWILGGSLSFAGLLVGSYSTFVKLEVGIYQNSLAEDINTVADKASSLSSVTCPSDSFAYLCEYLATVGKHATDGDAQDQWSAIYHRTQTDKLDIVRTSKLWSVENALQDVSNDITAMKHDRERELLPSWTIWLTMFSPHIFSFVFPLRLGRALAAFAF